MKVGLLWSCCVGCSFAPGTAVTSDGALDAALDGEVVDTPRDAAAAPGCDVIPTGLVACYAFDGASLATFVDDAGDHDATAAGFTAVTRDVPAASPAIAVGANAAAKVPDSPAFGLTNDFTITAWMRPDGPDAGANEGIVDHEGAWALSIFEGKLRCWSNRTSGLFVAETTRFVDQAWQLVACEVTGHQGCIHRIDAAGNHARTCAQVTGNGTSGGNGITIGSFQNGTGAAEERFGGALDDLRIYGRALTDAELCVLAGRTSCPLE